MNFLAYIREAFANLINAKLRSFLAILGILVGTASVVALISSGQMATQHALAQFKTLGTNLLALGIESNNFNSGSGQSDQSNHFHLSDLPVIYDANKNIELIAPYIDVFSPITYKGQSVSGQVIGVTEAMYSLVKLKLNKGRFVTYLDNENYYCVIGDKIAEQLRQKGMYAPMGRQLQIGSMLYTIVGVLAPWQTNLFLFADLNSSVVVPLVQSYQLSQYAHINNVLFRLKKGSDLKAAQQDIHAKVQLLLPKKHLTFRSPKQIIGIMSKQRATFTWLLAMIGGISLLVGGIGVMNIMLVSVIERRREIGIRMAVGARATDIRWMFLLESVTLTMFGGLVGVILGVTISVVLAEIAHWGFQFFALPPILGFVVSVLVGVLSGFYPAYRASKLDPIETLHGE
jgi:putative ABC transport system permease protein